MAQAIHLFLKIDGNDVLGESSVQTLGRENSIECVSLFHEVATAVETRVGATQTAGRRQHSPVTFTKRIDRSSPFLYQALAQRSQIEAEFRFYRQSSGNDGTTEHFYSIHLQHGIVTGIRLEQLNVYSAEYSAYPQLERVSFAYQNIAWTYPPTSASYADSVIDAV